MRGKRAKKLRRFAYEHPMKFTTGWYQGTLIHGGVRGAYLALKRRYVKKALYSL